MKLRSTKGEADWNQTRFGAVA